MLNYLYEPPAALFSLDDWTRFRDSMRQEVSKYPSQIEAQSALAEAEAHIAWIESQQAGLRKAA